MECKYCSGACIKRGKRKGIQCYQCTTCKKYQQKEYKKPRIPASKYAEVHSLVNKGIGIRALGKHLHISKSSVQRIIERLAKTLPEITIEEAEGGSSYEIDELCTCCGNKKRRIWVIYAINRKTKQMVSFCVGRRTKKNLRKVVRAVLRLKVRHIYTDRLNIYASLIRKEMHRIYPKCTNHIERKNLTLRTRLKRLGRRTICFTRSGRMLHNVICLWRHSDPFVQAA